MSHWNLAITVEAAESSWDLEGRVLEILREAGYAASVERLRRPDHGRLALTFAVVAQARPEIAMREIAAALAALPAADVLIGER